MKLAERVAIVTGGALGIGKAIATACAREGARLILCDIAAPALASAEAEVRALGASVLSLRVDVTDSAQVAVMVETVLKTWGRIDILVNNAGGGIGPKGLIETRDDEWDAVVNLNLKSQFLCCREVAAPMRRQAWGRIVNIASNAGRYRSNTGFGGLAYSAAKGESSSSPGAWLMSWERRHHRERDRARQRPVRARVEGVRSPPRRASREGARGDAAGAVRARRGDREHCRLPRLRGRQLHHRCDHRREWWLVRGVSVLLSRLP